MDERINRILHHELFLECVQKNELEEKDRIFCHHDMAHFLDTARIAMIYNLKEKLEIPEGLIYACGLLHDIGRFEQYQNNTPHQIAALPIAERVLKDCGFSETEKEQVLRAIENHRNQAISEEQTLSGIFYRADKASRACYACKAEKECSWKGSKKNREILQ